MPAAERDRRLLAAERKELTDLFASLSASNRHVQEYAVARIMAFRSERARELLAPFLDDPREIARVLAASAIANFPSRPRRSEDDSEAAALTQKLFAKLLAATGDAEVEAITMALRKFQPKESFRLALAELATLPEPGSAQRERAIDVAFQSLRKSWVPDLCDALTTRRAGRSVEVPGVREILRRALGVDYGFDTDQWKSWWAENRARFRDTDP